ncbi:MAG: sulfatase [Polyangiaceae bacterium]
MADPRAPSSAIPQHPELAPANVLLIMIDSLRGEMPWTGYPRDVVPRIDAFRREHCVTYAKAYSLSSYTAKSVAPALRGEYPSAMLRDGYFFTRYPDDANEFIQEMAQKRGLRTLASHAHGYFSPTFGLNQGFADYRLLKHGVDLAAVHSITSAPLTELAIEQLSDRGNVAQDAGKRFFAYVHYMDPHHTYEPHPEFSFGVRTARDLYDGEVRFTDHWVGKLLDFVQEQAWWRDTTVIITADHGESFGERGHYRHGFELWESVVRVPLLVCHPGLRPRVISSVRRSHIDLAPTIASMLRVSPSRPFRGKSLVSELLGDEPPSARRILVDQPRSDLMDRRRALIDGRYKLISFGDDRRFRLYDLDSSPWEAADITDDAPEVLERMKSAFAEEWRQVPEVEVLPGPPLKNAPFGRRW